MSDVCTIASITKGFSTVESRWARFGPYYAMFTIEFACEVISQYSNPDDLVLDPFAGRGSSIFAAAAMKRKGFGVEINPVGWLYSNVKLRAANKENVVDKLKRLVDLSKNKVYVNKSMQASEFFAMCFSKEVLAFLHAAKDTLNWKSNSTDATLMSFIVLYLHGKREFSLSNQMPMTKSTSISYSIEWWKSKGFENPPEIDILSFFEKRLLWRNEKGAPFFSNATVLLGDSTKELSKYTGMVEETRPVKLLFTSPPYYGVTNYFVDQWLRMWMLGGAPEPSILTEEKYKKRFSSKTDYVELLDVIFGQCALMMSQDSTVYVRTDVREFTLETTRQILKKYFPDYSYREESNSCSRKSQTELLNNSKSKPCEIDIILQR